jgi:pimeloyl-ACP methyl ester carboxylesterase
MELGRTMPQTVAPHMPPQAEIDACRWLTDDELDVYAGEFRRTGFQGGLNWYRCVTSERFTAELTLFAGRTIDVPACFIAGQSDWGIHQTPGALAAMERHACTRYQGTQLLPGAGHWVQQEQPERVTEVLVGFLGVASTL